MRVYIIVLLSLMLVSCKAMSISWLGTTHEYDKDLEKWVVVSEEEAQKSAVVKTDKTNTYYISPGQTLIIETTSKVLEVKVRDEEKLPVAERESILDKNIAKETSDTKEDTKGQETDE